MDFGQSNTFSREQLLGLPSKTKRDNIMNLIDRTLQHQVINAAKAEKTSTLLNIAEYIRDWKMSVDDLVEGLQSKFPGCRVEYTEVWEEVSPGTKQRKMGIMIDWSKPVSGLVTSIYMGP